MKYKQHMMMFATILISSFTVEAQQNVYKNVDSQGRVEFSDKPNPGGKAVDVNPNVVDVAPVKPLKPSPPAAAKAADAPGDTGRPEVTPEIESSGYYDDTDNRREKLREAKERREHAEKPVQLPAHKKPGKAAVQGGAHRR